MAGDHFAGMTKVPQHAVYSVASVTSLATRLRLLGNGDWYRSWAGGLRSMVRHGSARFKSARPVRSGRLGQEFDDQFCEPCRPFAVDEMPGIGDLAVVGTCGERTNRAAKDLGTDAPVAGAEDDSRRNRNRSDGEAEL